MCTTNKFKRRTKNKTNKIFYGMASNSLKHLFLLFRIYIDKLVDFIFSLFWENHQAIPDLYVKHRILMESATSLAKKIRNQELKAEDLIRAVIERIKLVNPILNAVTDERYDDAIKDAQNVDKIIADGLPDEYFIKKPFLGVPFTSKDSHAVCGMTHSLGLVSRKHIRASEDAECVRLLKEAGAIPVALTNVPEILKWQETRNMLFGQTNNPYHSGRTTGGSSGGEAALMAAIATPISLCSDIGGSTRMPAFYCGLFGHNPTANTTSLKGSSLRTGEEDSMASIGLVSRHCEDLAPLTKVIAGDKADQLKLDRVIDIKEVKYYYVETATDLRVSNICGDLRKAMIKVVNSLSIDSKPTPYKHHGFSYMFALWKYHMSKEAEDFPKLLTNNKGRAIGIVELVKKILGLSEYTLAAILKCLDDQILPVPNAAWAERLTKEMKDDICSLLGDEGVLLFPSAPHPAPYHYSLLLRPFNFSYWGVFNALRLPATQVPLGLNSQGLPLGIQVVAGPNNDALCIAVAKHLEQTFGGYVPPCKIRGLNCMTS